MSSSDGSSIGTNCRQAPRGTGYCDKCAAGLYEECRYLVSADTLSADARMITRIKGAQKSQQIGHISYDYELLEDVADHIKSLSYRLADAVAGANHCRKMVSAEQVRAEQAEARAEALERALREIPDTILSDSYYGRTRWGKKVKAALHDRIDAALASAAGAEGEKR